MTQTVAAISYAQSNTKKEHENYVSRYLYIPVDNGWNVGPTATPGVKAGSLHNPTRSKTQPLVGQDMAC